MACRIIRELVREDRTASVQVRALCTQGRCAQTMPV